MSTSDLRHFSLKIIHKNLKSLEKIRKLQIFSKRLVTSTFAGAYKSVFRGRGMEFEKLAVYQPGDDVRSIDWNVTARTGIAYVKRFVEEREMALMLVLDKSASMKSPLPGRLKNEVAAEICALLAVAANCKNDQIGLLTFSDKVEKFIPPAKGIRHVFKIITEITAESSLTGSTDLAGALKYLQTVIKPSAIVFIISDFIATNFAFELVKIGKCHDTIACCVQSRYELNLCDLGLLQVRDVECGLQNLIDTSSPKVRFEYAKSAAARESLLKQKITETGSDFLPIDTITPPIQLLMRFFQKRQHLKT